MIIAVAIVVFLAGAAAGVLALWRALPRRMKQHIDYRQRWEDAVSLLGTQGQLTAEQVDQITGPSQAAPAPAPVPSAPAEPAVSCTGPSPSTLRTLHRMPSWDRADLEIARAKQKLPPLDDLAGMAPWDQKEVLKARLKAGTG